MKDWRQCCVLQSSICNKCRNILVCPYNSTQGSKIYRKECALYEELPNPLNDYVNSQTTRSGNPIEKEKKMEAPELVEKSQAEIAKNAWKDRLKEEYAQLKERYEKLKAYNNKKEVESYLMGDCIMKQEEYHNNRLLKEQQHVMGEYLHILELRAELAHIEL